MSVSDFEDTLPDETVAAEAVSDSSAPDQGQLQSVPVEEAKPMPLDESDVESLDADPVKDEITALLETPNGPFELSSGTRVVVRQLKLREFLSLLRIVTRGAAPALGSVSLDFDNPTQFVQSLFGVVLFAIPEATEETVEFVQTVVEPADLKGLDAKAALAKREALIDELFNPELEDLINIVAVVVASEGADLQKLGKRLKTMFGVASKMGLTGNISVTR
jgi:hypothetical protein